MIVSPAYLCDRRIRENAKSPICHAPAVCLGLVVRPLCVCLRSAIAPATRTKYRNGLACGGRWCSRPGYECRPLSCKLPQKTGRNGYACEPHRICCCFAHHRRRRRNGERAAELSLHGDERQPAQSVPPG